MQPLTSVFRFEASGEMGIPFPSLHDAMRDAPTSIESHVSTSVDGVVLAEAQPMSCRKRQAQYAWAPTVAGLDVLAAAHGGIRCAS